jgi:hypothetical protein
MSGSDLFFDVKSSDKVLDVKLKLSRCQGIDWDLNHLYCSGALLKNHLSLFQHRIGPNSLVEIVESKWFNGFDVTQYWKSTFCPGCPWTQVDVKLAKICIPCAEEKFAILNHSRHSAWTPLFKAAHGDDSTPTPRNKQGNCMICTNIARVKCVGCPLVVCINCSTHLDGRCKFLVPLKGGNGSLTTWKARDL